MSMLRLLVHPLLFCRKNEQQDVIWKEKLVRMFYFHFYDRFITVLLYCFVVYLVSSSSSSGMCLTDHHYSSSSSSSSSSYCIPSFTHTLTPSNFCFLKAVPFHLYQIPLRVCRSSPSSFTIHSLARHHIIVRHYMTQVDIASHR